MAAHALFRTSSFSSEALNEWIHQRLQPNLQLHLPSQQRGLMRENSPVKLLDLDLVQQSSTRSSMLGLGVVTGTTTALKFAEITGSKGCPYPGMEKRTPGEPLQETPIMQCPHVRGQMVAGVKTSCGYANPPTDRRLSQ
ncbi:hypothetical protein EYF80_001394 [Liparis tanakae]|uniref:Uncharacterized protein n=1 Tax=Liparis tanakae TaxID=230148 RepID=A0A4Z2JEX2_9TELE|nr:hypothetical protein EYF80_001394 [Liparis tanakae]